MYNHKHSTLHTEAQDWLLRLEFQGRQAIDYVDGIRVAVYDMINKTLYWFVDVETDEEFSTFDFNDAVDALVYAVS